MGGYSKTKSARATEGHEMKKPIVYSLLAAILLIGFGLRYHNYTTWPREGATFDEFAWTFLGLSLLDYGVPISWSPHAAYTDRVEYYNPQGAHFRLVMPYVEHPPLFGLVAGGFARLNGVRTFDEVTVSKIRPLALIMGVTAIAAVFALATSLYGEGVGLTASFLYAIIPTIAVGSRLVQNENFFMPVFLFALYFAHGFLKTGKQKDLVVASVLAGILPLAKVPWVAAPLAVMTIFLYAKRWRAALVVLLITVMYFLFFVLYGLLLDSSVFLNLWKLQLARYDMAFDSIFVLFRDPIIVDRTFVDGWIYVGYIAMFLLFIGDTKKHLTILSGFLAYLAIFAFAIPAEPLHGWYRYPLYPFLTIATAKFFISHFNRTFLAAACVMALPGLSMLSESWGKAFGFSYLVLRMFLVAVAIGALPGFVPSWRRCRVFQWLNGAIACGIALLSVWAILIYNEQ